MSRFLSRFPTSAILGRRSGSAGQGAVVQGAVVQDPQTEALITLRIQSRTSG